MKILESIFCWLLQTNLHSLYSPRCMKYSHLKRKNATRNPFFMRSHFITRKFLLKGGKEKENEFFSLFDGVSGQLFLCAVRADDVLIVRDEAFADHRGFTGGADEAVVVPVTTLERDEARSADACLTRFNHTQNRHAFHISLGLYI